MKQRIISRLITLIALVILTGRSNAEIPVNPNLVPAEIKATIVKLIDKPDLSNTQFEEAEAVLHFVINAKSQIVVLWVETDVPFVDQLLKSKLNYKSLATEDLEKEYTLKVTIKNG